METPLPSGNPPLGPLENPPCRIRCVVDPDFPLSSLCVFVWLRFRGRPAIVSACEREVLSLYLMNQPPDAPQSGTNEALAPAADTPLPAADLFAARQLPGDCAQEAQLRAELQPGPTPSTSPSCDPYHQGTTTVARRATCVWTCDTGAVQAVGSALVLRHAQDVDPSRAVSVPGTHVDWPVALDVLLSLDARERARAVSRTPGAPCRTICTAFARADLGRTFDLDNDLRRFGCPRHTF